MVKAPRFSIALLRRVLAAATGPDGAEAGEEACGLLVGHGADVGDAVPTRNVSSSPHESFEIDPVALLAAHRAGRASGPALLGFWHTHPSGDPTPSRRDAADAAPDGRLWLIATAREVRLWRAVADGAVHGRFDPVRFDVTDEASGARVEKDVAAVQHRAAGRDPAFAAGGGNDI